MTNPCQECGAGAGEPCEPWCVVPESMDVQPDDSLSRIAAAVHLLPFSTLIGEPPYRSGDDDEYLRQLADWMELYQKVCQFQVDDLMEQSRQRIALQIEKDVVRSFFAGAIKETV